jgi:hypothetical protein
MKMSKDNDSKVIVVRPATDLTLNFHQSSSLVDEKDVEKSKVAIIKHGVYSPDGRTFIATDALCNLLATDPKGAKRAYLNMSDEDKLINENTRYASVPAIQKEISKRIEEPRDAYARERLRENERLLTTLRDAPQLEKIRAVAESKIREGQSTLKSRKIKAEGISNCQVTGEALENDAHAHHIVRKADSPREALNLDNIAVVNKAPHEKIHRFGAETKEEFSDLCQKEGWNDPTKG